MLIFKGMDLSSEQAVTLSNGERRENPRQLRKVLARLRRAQQDVSRKPNRNRR